MGFLKQLAKGFIRSAVNQVGRDGGRVVSNKVYGDAHSIPIRQVGGQSTTNSQTSNSTNAPTENLIQKKEYIGIKFFLAILLSTFLPILGGLIVIYRGFVNFNKDHKTLHRIEKQSVYASDKRYSTGRRYEGHKEVAVPVKVEIDENQKSRNRFKSYGYFLIGLYGLFFGYYFFSSFDKTESPRLEIIESENIAISKGLSDLMEEPSKDSKKLKLIFAADTIQLLNETKINADSTRIWYKVEYKGTEGWTDNPINKID